MANLQEHSSSTSYTSPSCISDDVPEAISDLEILSLNKLSSRLGCLLNDEQFNFNDAEIETEGSFIPIHRCILAARSSFFYELFSQDGSNNSVKKSTYHMKDLLPFGHVGCDVFRVFLWYLYTGKIRHADLDVRTCMDEDCPHDACRPAINFLVEITYASYCFKITELLPVFQEHLLEVIDKVFVEELIPILQVAFHTEQSQLIEHCAHKLAHSNFDDTYLIKELPIELSQKIRYLRHELGYYESLAVPANSFAGKKRKIQDALDQDDIELVKMLLEESDISLDDVNALHYAAAYRDSKIVAEILELGANVDMKNARGYTPLHVAAMRMEPAVIMELLSKRASILVTTEDGRRADGICRRLTTPKDYNTSREKCKESNKRRICIDILEQELQRPIVGGEPVESLSSPENLQVQANDLETRVSIARLVFPAEAKLAMEIAETACRRLDLNETPTQQLHARINKLKRTVELGRRYFPHCSEWLDNFTDEDHKLELCGFGGTDLQELKRRRFDEITKDVLDAFSKDMAKKECRSRKNSSRR